MSMTFMTVTMLRRALPLVGILALAQPAAARDNRADQKAQADVRSLIARVGAAEKAGDALAVSQCYENDGMLLPSSGEPVMGREEIAKRYKAIFAGSTPRLPLEAEELWVTGDWAVSRGATRGPAPRRNVKGPVRNRYVMTFKRHGDSWEIHSLVWTPTANAQGRD